MNDLRKRPFHENTERNSLAEQRRRSANNYSAAYAAVPTEQNTDEGDFADQQFLACFTKGLPHDEFANLANGNDYVAFVNEINQQDATNFDAVPRGLSDASDALTERKPDTETDTSIEWRGWESPRAGHYFDLQGPDADAVAMPPAPALGSEELIAEMSEVYALALLRDVPFSDIEKASKGESVNPTITGLDVNNVLDELSKLSWFTDTTPGALSTQERRRRAARRVDHGENFSLSSPPDNATFSQSNAFRGSGPGAKAGPYVSQFMLLGNKQEHSGNNTLNASIAFGRQVIDQKMETLPPGKDYLVNWNAFVDVQNGANFGSDTDKAVEELREERRFITTPRDLAAYVRYDALYQAYLNACLYMLGSKSFSPQAPVNNPYTGATGPGFPDGQSSDPNKPASRQAFATFGGPHILSLVTEVATRCLKAVRRQKFNYHRRARPERIGALLSLRGTVGDTDGNDRSGQIDGSAAAQIDNMLRAPNLGDMLRLVSDHNNQLIASGNADPHLDFSSKPDASWYANTSKYLLPMAFAEGSPMHPSYGAGHATVAGGCVTMLKAFFNTTDADGNALPWPSELTPMQGVLTSDTQNPSQLEPAADIAGMTLNGELNKLAANISIGRNMAGVHYYTDYYESLRMGERIATGILIEQMKQYNEPVEFSFESFDGDHIHIYKNDFDFSEPRVYVHLAERDDAGNRIQIDMDQWWYRHTKDDTPTLVFARSQTSNTDTRKKASA